MGGFADFLNETLPQEEVKKSAFLGFLDTFTKDEPTTKSEQTTLKIEQPAPKTGFTSFLDATLPPDSGATNAAVKENIETIPPPQTEEYVDYAQAPPKEKAPWYDDYLGLIRPLLAGAQAGAAGITKGLLKAADFISDKLGIPKSNAARIVADDLEKFSQANKARGVGGIVGDVASGIGRAAVDIPAIMALGPAGLPVFGGLMGAAEGGVPGAVTGAVSGALTHGALKGIGGLKTPARVGAGAAFGAATTPGGLEERVKGAATMGVLSATGGRPQRGVIDLRGKVPETAPARPVAGQTALPPPPIETPTARIVPEAEKPFFGRESTADYLKQFQAKTTVPPPTEAVGRVTKTTVPATADQLGKELPHGPTVTGEAPSPVNPIVKTLGPQGMSLTKATLDELMAQPKVEPRGAIKRAIRNPIYLFNEVPVLKKYIRDVDVEADHNIAVESKQVKSEIKTWRQSVEDKSGKRIWIHAIAQQKGGPETLDAMGIKDRPTLTVAETKVYDGIRGRMEEMYGRINEARTLLGLDPIGKIENYFTFLRKAEELEQKGHDLVADPDAMALTANLNKPTDPSFFKQRGLSTKPLESKLFDIYEYYMRKANHYIQKAPMWANSKLLLSGVEYKDASGQVQKYDFSKENPKIAEDIQDYVEFTVRPEAPSAIEYTFKGLGRRAAQAINKNMAAAVLSVNLRSALIQPTSLRNSYIELGRRWLFEGVKRGAFNPNGYKEAIRLSKVLLGRVFDVHQATLKEGSSLAWATAGKIQRKVAEWGITPLKYLDMAAAVITWQGAYAQATAPRVRGGLGLSGKEAVLRADDVVTMTQASGAARDISKLQRTPEGKLASVFQTFVINEWNYLAENAIGWKNTRLTNPERFQRMFRLVIGTLIANVIMEDVLKMRSPFPAPEHALVSGLRGGEKAGKIAVDVAREFGEQLPIVGGSIRWTTPSRVALPATAQLVSDLAKLMAKAGMAVSEHDLSKMKAADLAVLGQAFGIPGTSQVLKTVRRREQGGTWPQSILGQKMESLGVGAAGLTKADKALLDKYGVGPGTSKSAPKKNQKAIDDLMKKYGVKK